MSARSLFVAASTALVIFASAASSSAATYVDAPTYGRPVTGVDVFAGEPIGASASMIGVGGTQARYGYAWENGVALHGVFGFGVWSARSTLGDALGDRRAAIGEGWGGVALRRAFSVDGFAPFVEGAILGEMLRVRGAANGETLGVALGAELGVRWRDAPLDLFLALDVRHARVSPLEGEDTLSFTRLSLVFGALLDVR